MTDFAQAFQNNESNFRCCAARVLWLVKLSRPIVQSHMTFFDGQGGIYSVNVFPS